MNIQYRRIRETETKDNEDIMTASIYLLRDLKQFLSEVKPGKEEICE